MLRESLGLESQLLPGFTSGQSLSLSLSLCIAITKPYFVTSSNLVAMSIIFSQCWLEWRVCTAMQEHKTLDEGTVHHVTVVHMGGELERSGRWLVFLCVVCECVVCVCVVCVCVCGMCDMCVCVVCDVCVVCVCVWCV